ncbi:unnamed protein product [Cylicocyclus nassatus]|uniref:Uncharacterized protein n=1 Tax=Cylicocyclus nassatus TaxID=53992 RepID=A0AA36H798_CYLNA|nr:unnamed protein product [Cylicocyclus nassatus]
MYVPLLVAFMASVNVYAIWPRKLGPDESAALDLVMRISKMTFKELNTLLTLQAEGIKPVQATDVQRHKDPDLYRKMVVLQHNYGKLSEEAKAYVDEVFHMAMEHTRSLVANHYLKPEELDEAWKLAAKMHELKIDDELESRLYRTFLCAYISFCLCYTRMADSLVSSYGTVSNKDL